VPAWEEGTRGGDRARRKLGQMKWLQIDVVLYVVTLGWCWLVVATSDEVELVGHRHNQPHGADVSIQFMFPRQSCTIRLLGSCLRGDRGRRTLQVNSVDMVCYDGGISCCSAAATEVVWVRHLVCRAHRPPIAVTASLQDMPSWPACQVCRSGRCWKHQRLRSFHTFPNW
jgi:hypothetical protein